MKWTFRHLLTPILVLLAAAFIGIFVLAGCGSPPAPVSASADTRSLRLAQQLDACFMAGTVRRPSLSGNIDFAVSLTEDGEVGPISIEQSTLGDDDVEVCMINALVLESWPRPATEDEPRGAIPGSNLLAQPQPAQPLAPEPDPGPISRVRPKLDTPFEPDPKSPFKALLRLVTPAAAGVLVFITITLIPRQTSPRWMDEINPETRKPYTGPQEFEDVQRRREKQQQPPEPVPPPQPAPQPKPSTEPEDTCKPVPVGPRGGNDPHNVCADTYPPNRWPGFSAKVNGKEFDALQKGAKVLWEIKTDEFSQYSANTEFYKEVVVKRILPRMLAELQREQALAMACKFDFIVGVTDPELKKALDRLSKKDHLHLTIKVIKC